MEFIRSMFRHLHSRRIPEPDILFSGITLQGAIAALRNSAGISREYLASRCFITHTQLVNLESRGKPLTPEVLYRFRDVCLEYNLPALAQYFGEQSDVVRFRKPMRKQTGQTSTTE